MSQRKVMSYLKGQNKDWTIMCYTICSIFKVDNLMSLLTSSSYVEYELSHNKQLW